MLRALVFALAFTGGFSVMSVEMLGGRILAPYFGSSVYVWGSIITVFMLALALGYLIGGQLSLKTPSLGKLAVIFVCAGLALLPVVSVADPLMRWVFDRIEDPRYGSLVAALTLFLLPTIILGMVSPYAVRLMVQTRRHSGQVAGRLYFVSTAGSALGTLLTSFYLILLLEINHILWILIGLLIAAGGIAWASGRGRVTV
jgi:MFS family permease